MVHHRGGLSEPAAVVFGPDRNEDGGADLYLSSFDGDSVLAYDGANGAFIDVFVPSGRGGMSWPRTIVFRPGDGAMLVTCERTDRVSAYDGTTGELIGVLITGIPEPTGMDFDSRGFLYVASLADNAVHRYDLATGDFVDTVVPSGRGGLSLPTFVLLLEACPADLDGSGAVDFGDILRILAAWGNTGGAEDLDESGVVDFGDLLIVLAAWGPCP